jgi:hypothetical protein
MGMRKIPYNGREVVGSDIPFAIVKDGSITLELEDGAKVHVRPVVVNVVKTEEKGPTGERLYIVESFVHINLATPAKEDQE